MSKKNLEEQLSFTPVFDEHGLIPCIITSAKTGKVLMFAFMNREALELSIKTGSAHYWSRSRQSLWRKGEESGLTHTIIEMRTDCDQDCLWISVEIGDGKSAEASCHTGRTGCFYRKVKIGGDLSSTAMEFIDDEKIFDPDQVYKS